MNFLVLWFFASSIVSWVYGEGWEEQMIISALFWIASAIVDLRKDGE